jgi:hypothetical protein
MDFLDCINLILKSENLPPKAAIESLILQVEEEKVG